MVISLDGPWTYLLTGGAFQFPEQLFFNVGIAKVCLFEFVVCRFSFFYFFIFRLLAFRFCAFLKWCTIGFTTRSPPGQTSKQTINPNIQQHKTEINMSNTTNQKSQASKNQQKNKRPTTPEPLKITMSNLWIWDVLFFVIFFGEFGSFGLLFFDICTCGISDLLIVQGKFLAKFVRRRASCRVPLLQNKLDQALSRAQF